MAGTHGATTSRLARPAGAWLLAWPLLVFAAYVITGRLGLLLASQNASATAVWAPTGLALAAVFLLGPRVAPAIFLGAFVVNVTTAGTVLTSLGIAAGNTLEALIGAWLTRTFAGPRPFDRVRDFTVFVFAACVFAPLVSATIGVVTLSLGGLMAPGTHADVLRTWWVGDAAGALLLAPLLIMWVQDRPGGTPTRAVEATLYTTVLLFGTLAVFGFVRPFQAEPIGFLLVPLVVYAGLRFGPLGTSLAVMAQAGVALAGTVRGHGPFIVDDPDRTLVYLQGFWAVLSLTGLGLAIVARERSQAQAALNANEERLRTAVEAAQLGAYDWDLLTGAMTWDERCRALLGAPPRGDVTYDAFLDAVHVDDRPRVLDVVQRARKPSSAGETYDVEFRVPRSRGGQRWLRTTGRCHFDDGAPVRFVGVVRDATGDREAEQDRRATRDQEMEIANLRAQDLFKTHLFNHAAHELNTPLTPLLMQLDMLRTPEMGPLTARQGGALDLLERNLKRLEGLVQDMLDVARLQGGRGAPARTTVRLDTLLDEAIASHRPSFIKANVALALDIAWGLRVDGDETRLLQVFGNLLSNAAKFTPPGGQVRIGAANDGKRVRVTVADSGVGVDEKDVPRLFQPFVQLQESVGKGGRAPTRGTGLGLYISRLIVQSHGGSIVATSDGVGKGTTFTMTLPSVAPIAPVEGDVTAAVRTPANS